MTLIYPIVDRLAIKSRLRSFHRNRRLPCSPLLCYHRCRIASAWTEATDTYSPGHPSIVCISIHRIDIVQQRRPKDHGTATAAARSSIWSNVAVTTTVPGVVGGVFVGPGWKCAFVQARYQKRSCGRRLYYSEYGQESSCGVEE